MKKYLLLPFLSIVITLGSALDASAQAKIGTVDMKKIFESYWKTKDAEANMSEIRGKVKRDLEERNDKRKQLQDQIEKLNEEIKKPELSKDTAQKKMKERDERIGEWQTMMRELQQYQAEKEKQLAEQTLRIRNGLVDEIRKVVSDKVVLEGFDLVFDVSGYSINNVPVVMYARDSYDFTKDIVDKLNADRQKSGSTPEKSVEPKGKK